MTAKQIVLLGAARSGTKILRDSLALATGAGRVPYDINYVWRFGNEEAPDDVLTPDQVTDRSRRFIEKFIRRYASDGPAPVVIEKTVGNTLRVPMVAKVLPRARFVHLIRDGVDVAESTRRQWLAPTDFRYLAKKAKHFPLKLIPSYGVKYVCSIVRRRGEHDRRVGSWGPRYPNIDADLRDSNLLVVCARQWRYAVETATTDLQRLGIRPVEVRYETLVSDPVGELSRVADSLDLPVVPEGLRRAALSITGGRAGCGRTALNKKELSMLAAEAGSLLEDLGYPPVMER